ncbi:MAG: hypothetical protein KHW83_07025, partial [Streptococcus sp.]|nr:hypothetical protein [Streptococcus sp.]MBS6631428.1 hypothetical protein [Lacticaseibacillus paracasei]
FSLDGMLCKHHFSKNGQVFFHIFWVVTLIMQSRYGMVALYSIAAIAFGFAVRATVKRYGRQKA